MCVVFTVITAWLVAKAQTSPLELHGKDGWPVDIVLDMDAYGQKLRVIAPFLSARLLKRSLELKEARKRCSDASPMCGSDPLVEATIARTSDLELLSEAANVLPGKSRDKALYAAILCFYKKTYRDLSGARAEQEKLEFFPVLQATRRVVEENVPADDIASVPLLLAEAMYYQRISQPDMAVSKLQQGLKLVRSLTGVQSAHTGLIELYGTFVYHAQGRRSDAEVLYEHYVKCPSDSFYR